MRPPPNNDLATTPPLPVVIGQLARWLIKKTVWTPLTTLCKIVGAPLQSVQILLVDRRLDQVLLLRTRESATGWFAVQGLRDIRLLRFPPSYGDDPRRDALRELIEEAVDGDALEQRIGLDVFLQQFHLLQRYWEGHCRQFDCRVYLVEADSRELRLRPENAEGLPVWVAIADAQCVLNPTLAELLARLPPAAGLSM